MSEILETKTHLDQAPILEKRVEEILVHVREQRNHALILGGVAFLSLQILAGLTEKDHRNAAPATLDMAAGRFHLIWGPAAGAAQSQWQLWPIAFTEFTSIVLGLWILWSAISLYGRPVAAGKDMAVNTSGIIERSLYLDEIDRRLKALYQDLGVRKQIIKKIEVRLKFQFVMLVINLFLVQWL